jgi:hypothetical protein
MDAFLSALPLVADPSVLLAIAVGSFIGLVFGAMPGLTFSLALAVVLPITFTMDMISAVGMLLGTYIGGMTGGSVPPSSSAFPAPPRLPPRCSTAIRWRAPARPGWRLARRWSFRCSAGCSALP